MIKTEEFIANRLLWKAGKYNLPTQWSFFFKDLGPEFQKRLLEQVNTALSGQPVLYFTKPTNEWTIVGARQVIGYDKRNVSQINLADINRISPADFDLAPGPVDISKVKKKSEWDRLKIEADRKTYILHSAPGTDLFALWNILSMAISII